MVKPIFHCQIEFFPNPHLSQIYDGFWKLKQKGIINLETKRINPKNGKPIIKIIVDKKHTLIYDTLDGFNWIDGSVEENLEYFRTNMDCEIYFKRSFNPILQDYAKNSRIYPLGLNLGFEFVGNYPVSIVEYFKSFYKKRIKQNSFYLNKYKHPPIINAENKILFLCGLWNPELVVSPELKYQRDQINTNRIMFVRECKSEFGSQFTGGIQIDDYSQRIAKDILAPKKLTNKRNFIHNIKTHNICIATTGLHNSIGWKFAEYTAASRAIISEPLHYELPGNFKKSKNYLSFQNTSELIDNIHSLLNNKNKMQLIMTENYNYFNEYVDSEKLIMNTLLKIHEI